MTSEPSSTVRPRPPVLSARLRRQLLAQGSLLPCTQDSAIQEQQSLWRLRQRPALFLNSYDRLFRHVSLWLIHQGYQFSPQSPHQTLSCLAEPWLPQPLLRSTIATRHALKYGEPTARSMLPQAAQGLYQMLDLFCPADAQAWDTHSRAIGFGIMP